MIRRSTERLTLEPLRSLHRAALARINGDAQVMRYITGRAQSMDEIDSFLRRAEQEWLQTGFSWWALIEATRGEMIGLAVVQNIARDKANPLEIGWRVRPDHWGCGYAAEAARSLVDFAWRDLAADQLLAIAHPDNLASIRVMQRIGMRRRGRESWYGKPNETYILTRLASDDQPHAGF